MDVGIIGSGRLGQAMARTALRAGRQVVLANSRGPESLVSVVSTLGEGASAGTVDEAAGAGIVVIAVPWPRVPEAVQGLHWDGRIVIDATNDFDPSDLNGWTSSQVLADLVPGARVVKAANTLGAAVLGSDPHEAGGRRVIFLSGDDAEAKSEVSTLFEDAGFVAIDLGGLVSGGAMQQLGGPLAGVNLIKLPMTDHTSISAEEAADRLAIRELVDAYAFCADRRDADGQKALFTEDTHFVVYMAGEGTDATDDLHGRESLTPVFDNLNRYEVTMHFNGQSTVALDGDRATGETYCLAQHVYSDDGERRLMIAALRYQDIFVKADGTWRFAERRLYVGWTETRTLEAAGV